MASAKSQRLRLRVFAGPNGSGKTTLINYIKSITVNGEKLDFGTYVNADDIALNLENDGVAFKKYGIVSTPKEFRKIALSSGLIKKGFSEKDFLASFSLRANHLKLVSSPHKELLAQVIADFLRKKLLKAGKKFSFETVFSHPSKMDIMNQAVQAGYKVYLYYVSTESADINVFRVKARRDKGGHDVPEIKIRSRYKRSMENLFEASLIADQTYFFDNSTINPEPKLVGESKKVGIWPMLKVYQQLPNWFIKYFVNKRLAYLGRLDS